MRGGWHRLREERERVKRRFEENKMGGMKRCFERGLD
jgi:hypothetical protein